MKEIRTGWKLPALLILITVLECYPILLRDVDFALTAHFAGPGIGFSYYYMQGFFSTLILICLLTYGGYGSFGEDFQQLDETTRICWRVAVFSVTVLLFFAPVVLGHSGILCNIRPYELHQRDRKRFIVACSS